MATVPDIRLQKPATMVADITTQRRQPSAWRRRRMLRMMMKGAAKTRNGTAAKAAGCGPACSNRKLAGRLVAAWYPVAKSPAPFKEIPVGKEAQTVNPEIANAPDNADFKQLLEKVKTGADFPAVYKRMKNNADGLLYVKAFEAYAAAATAANKGVETSEVSLQREMLRTRQLAAARVTPLIDLPVGENLQDHLLVGVVYSYSILIWPDGALAIVFLIVIAVLIWRPWGLFGTELRT